MKRNLWIALASLALASSVFAENCPSIQSIKSGTLAPSWQLLDGDTSNPLTAQQNKQYRHFITQFALAEQIEATQDTPAKIRCYYRNNAGAGLEVYLERPSMKAIITNQWYAVTGAKHCAASIKACGFQADSTSNFATNQKKLGIKRVKVSL